MSETRPRRCRECGKGTIRPIQKEGPGQRTVAIPTCDHCGNEWIDPETAEALDEALRREDAAQVEQKARP